MSNWLASGLLRLASSLVQPLSVLSLEFGKSFAQSIMIFLNIANVVKWRGAMPAS